ncbi:MAG TPA: dethiobiotin synthase [Kofleriaceae bacterium]
MNGYFITGTGTGVGKTFIACELARCARNLGHRVFAFKPIETGCVRGSSGLVGSDQELLCEAAGGWQDAELRGAYQFEPPVAPLVAAEQAGLEIDLPRIDSIIERGARSSSFVIIEGAGGWRVPITPSVDMAVLAQRCGLPVIVVAQAGLGTINHSLLTVEAVERDGQRIAALVLSKHPDEDDAHVADNAHRIASRWPGTILIYRRPEDLSLVVSRGTP